MVVQVLASAETWIWYALPDAASHCKTTWQIVWVDPRSTWIHCGSLKALDQRVPALPSTAFAAGKEAFSVEEAVAGRPCARFEVPQLAAEADGAAPGSTSPANISAAVARVSTRARRDRTGAVRPRPRGTPALVTRKTRASELRGRAGCMASPWVMGIAGSRRRVDGRHEGPLDTRLI